MKEKGQRSLEKKFLRKFIYICIGCFAVSSVVISFFIRDVLKRNTLISARKECAQNRSAIERHIDDYYYATYTIQNSKSVVEAMTREPEDSADPYYMKRQLEAQLNVLTGTMSLYPISLYFYGDAVYRDNIMFHSASELEKYEAFADFRTSDQSYIWLPPEEVRFSNLNRDVKAFPFLRKVGDNRNPVAFQKVSIRAKEIEDLITLGEEAECVLVYSGEDHEVLLEKGVEKSGIKADALDAETLHALVEREDWTGIRLGGKNVYIYAEAVKGTDWVMVNLLSEQSYLSSFRGIFAVWAAALLVLSLIYFAFDRRYSRHIVERVRLLETHMGSLLEEEPVPITYQEEQEKDELDFVIEYYNETLEKMKELMTRRIQDEKEKRRLEQSLIQAQINPHFLYNTLDLIKWKALDANVPEIGEITYRLSEFYKLSLNCGREIVTVQDEVRHVQNYIELQKLRFGADISLVVELPEELLGARIPKITLQPLAENSIQHGFLVKEDREDCLLELYGWREEGALVLMLQDNGAGMTQETVEGILERSPSSNLHGFGIRNIHERLQLYCGAGYGLTYESTPGEGTTVYIRISDQL